MAAANNTIQTSTRILKECMRHLHNSLTFAKSVNRQYDTHFGEKGAKDGETIYARLPNQYYVSDGANMVVQNGVERTVAVNCSTRKHVGISYSTQDLTTKTGWNLLVERTIKPAMATLASKIDLDGLALASQIYNSVGTPATTPGANSNNTGLGTTTAPKVYLNAGMMLDNYAVPRDGQRFVCINPAAQAETVGNLSGLFNSQKAISDQYINGEMGGGGNILGFRFLMDQNVGSITCGSRANGTVAGANQTGANLAITGAGANANVAAGDVFTIDGVYSVNPETQQSTGQLQQFVVTAAANLGANGNGTVNIVPNIVVAGANIANGTVSAVPGNGANLTWVGAANATSVMNLAYHRDAFALVTAPLYLPESAAVKMRETFDGISMRLIKDYNVSDDNEYARIDVLYGWTALRKEMACRIAG